MKNSPEHVLKKMYTGVGRTWKDVSFNHTNTFGPNYVVPDMVMALTGNTTVKMVINSYILSQPTPNPVFDSMRVDVSVFFAPQRNYVRGLIGDNFIETREIEDFDLPMATLTTPNIPAQPAERATVQYVGATGEWSVESMATDKYNSFYRAVLPGSLLHRLGFPAFIVSRNFIRGIYDANLTKGQEPSIYFYNDSSVYFGKRSVTFNMSTVCAYYDICRYFLSNLMTDEVPVGNGSWNKNGMILPNLPLVVRTIDSSGVSVWSDFTNPIRVSPEMYSLASFGSFLNAVRGVSNDNTTGATTIQSMNNLFIKSDVNRGATIAFNNIELMDCISGMSLVGSMLSDDGVELKDTWRGVGTILKNTISSTGLWPTRYDSHFQTMYFDASKVQSLMQVSWSNNVESYRLAESEFATKLKRLLRGMRYKSWADVTFGARVKMDDHPIMLGKDSYYLRFQDIVNTGSQTQEIPLGASVGRAVGGNKSALREKKGDEKEYVFTTQEPGYLFVLYSVVPTVSYANVLPRYLTFKKFGDFAIPQKSGKQFEDLICSDFFATFTDRDDIVVGRQPIYFDNLTSFNKVGGAFATDLKNGFVFRRDFGGIDLNTISNKDYGKYLGNTYVEPGVFDDNFEDQGVNGRQVFNVKTYYDLKVCVPLEDQVTDYNI